MPVTNPYYQDQFQGQPGQSAKAEQVNGEFLGVQGGFDAVLVFQNATVQGQPGETLTVLPSAAGRANKWLRFDNNGNPLVVSSPLNVRGAWAASTAYNVGDTFTAAPNGSLYYVKTAYTSGLAFGSTDITNTILLVSLAGLYFVNNVVVTGPATLNAVDGGSYLLDSSGGNITVNLPNESVIGNSPVNITHVGGTLAAGQAITVLSASGQFIMGITQNQLNVDVTNASASLMWGGATYGWRLRVMG